MSRNPQDDPFTRDWRINDTVPKVFHTVDEPAAIIEGGVGRLESLTVKISHHSLSGVIPPTPEDREEMTRRMDWADTPNVVGKSNASEGASGDQTYFGGGVPSPVTFTGETTPWNSGKTKDPILDSREMHSRDFPRHPMCRCTLVEKTIDPAWDRYFELAFGQMMTAWASNHEMKKTVKVAGDMADLMLAERRKRMEPEGGKVVGDASAVKTVGQVMEGRDWLTVAEARDQHVCRICKVGINEKPLKALVVDLGKEFAHRECLKRIGEKT